MSDVTEKPPLRQPLQQRSPEAELAEHNRALQALNRLAAQLLSMETAEAIYVAALHGILDVVGTSRGALTLADNEQCEFRMSAREGYKDATWQLLDHMPYGIPSAHNVARETGEIVVIHPDTTTGTGQMALLEEEMQTAVLVPLVRAGEVIGVLSYMLPEYRECTPLEGEILRTASTYVSSALERAHLFEQVRRNADLAQAEYERMAAVVANVDTAISIHDAEGRFTMVNAAWERYAGYAPGEVLGRTHADFAGEPYASQFDEALRHVLATGESITSREVFYSDERHPDGLYIDGSIVPMRNPAGDITGALIASLDVTEKVRARQGIEAERARLEHILEQLPVGVFIAEGEPAARTFRWTLINREGKTQFGAPIISPGVESETFTIHHPDGRLYTEDELPLQFTIWNGVPPPDLELVFRYHNGEERTFVSTISLLSEDGDTRTAVAVSQDITERKRLTEQVRRQAEALQAEYERLATLVANVDLGISLIDTDLRHVLVNDTWLKQTGYRREEVLGRRYDEFALSPTVQQSMALLEHVLATGKPFHVHELFTTNANRPDGWYADASIVPIRDASGHITGLLSAALDVTEKVRSRQEVEAQRALLETIVQGVPVGIAFYDREMRLVNLNAEWGRMMGVDPIEVRGKVVYDVLPDFESRRAAHRRALAGEDVAAVTVPFTRAGDSKPRFYDLSLRPVRDASGEVTGILSAVVDVTERHELDQQKDEFIALASHELRTPITAIKGYTQISLRNMPQPADPRLERTLRIIDDKADSLTRLISELLDVSRMRAGILELYTEPLDLGGLVREIVGSLELTAPSFTFDLELPNTPLPVEVDRERIEQVVTNLMNNAIKYSGASRKVEVCVRRDGEEAVVSVRDFGVGVPPEQQTHVFDRFFRASNVATPRFSGLGLGLFISHGIVERHGGRMWLESVEGEGSAFYFALPTRSETDG